MRDPQVTPILLTGILLLIALILSILSISQLQSQSTQQFLSTIARKKAEAPGGGGGLDDTGILVRYYIDDETAGTTADATTVSDAGGGTAINLTVTDNNPSRLEWVDNSGQQGIEHRLTTVSNARWDATIGASDKLDANLNGSTTATVELVVSIDGACSTGGGRLFAINDTAGGNAELGFLATTDVTDMRFYVNGTEIRSWDGGDANRNVWHAVVDFANKGSDSFCVIYKNGSDFSASTTKDSNSPPGTSITFSTGYNIIFNNRSNGGTYERACIATYYYGAMYSSAFNASQVSNNNSVLSSSDDTP